MKKNISKLIFMCAFAMLLTSANFVTAYPLSSESKDDSNSFPQLSPPPSPDGENGPKMEKAEFNALVKVAGGKKTISKETLETDEDGLNAVFVHGKNSLADVSNVKIRTKQNGSRGLYAAFGGKINARNVEISTLGEHSAAFATDMGGGTITINKGKAETAGKGSPVLYCTGSISAKNLTGKASDSEIAVIEGKNSLSIENSSLTGGAGLDGEVKAGIMVYQSMSGDSERGTAFLTVKNSNLTNVADGPFIFATNTSGVVNLSSTKITNKSGILLLASGNSSKRGWGQAGSNGAHIELNAEKQNLEGEIQVDKISSVELNLRDGAYLSGFVDSAKNGTASINISKKAKAEFTADSYFDKFNDSDETFKNIKSNGKTIFYNKNNSENAYLHGKTILLTDGGKIAPAEYEKTSAMENSSAPKDDKNPPLPNKGLRQRKLESKTGTLQVSNGKAFLIDSENKITVLKLMEEKRGQMPEPQENKAGGGFQMGGQSQPPAFGQQFQPPMDFMQGADGGFNQMEAGGQKRGEKPPKPVTLEDLKKYSGRKVEVKGIQEMDGSFTVFEIAEAK